MAVKIRLQRKGRKKNPFYHIVVADARAPRDGKYIERIGSYNPMTNPATITLDVDKSYEWLKNGAVPTYTANAILRFKGVLYKKHLMRGVAKGALTEEQAHTLFEEYRLQKENRVNNRIEAEKLSVNQKKSELTSFIPSSTSEEVPSEETADGEEA